MTTKQILSENLWSEAGGTKTYYTDRANLDLKVNDAGVFVRGNLFGQNTISGILSVHEVFGTIEEAEKFVSEKI